MCLRPLAICVEILPAFVCESSALLLLRSLTSRTIVVIYVSPYCIHFSVLIVHEHHPLVYSEPTSKHAATNFTRPSIQVLYETDRFLFSKWQQRTQNLPGSRYAVVAHPCALSVAAAAVLVPPLPLPAAAVGRLLLHDMSSYITQEPVLLSTHHFLHDISDWSPSRHLTLCRHTNLQPDTCTANLCFQLNAAAVHERVEAQTTKK